MCTNRKKPKKAIPSDPLPWPLGAPPPPDSAMRRSPHLPSGPNGRLRGHLARARKGAPPFASTLIPPERGGEHRSTARRPCHTEHAARAARARPCTRCLTRQPWYFRTPAPNQQLSHLRPIALPVCTSANCTWSTSLEVPCTGSQRDDPWEPLAEHFTLRSGSTPRPERVCVAHHNRGGMDTRSSWHPFGLPPRRHLSPTGN